MKLLYRKTNTDDLFGFTIRSKGSLNGLQDVIKANEYQSINAIKDAPIGSKIASTDKQSPRITLQFASQQTNNELAYLSRSRKQQNQNLFDYVLTQYGSLESIGEFLSANAITGVGRYNATTNFERDKVGTKYKAVTPNDQFAIYLLATNKVVATNVGKSFGDFNIDFNIDTDFY